MFVRKDFNLKKCFYSGRTTERGGGLITPEPLRKNRIIKQIACYVQCGQY